MALAGRLYTLVDPPSTGREVRPTKVRRPRGPGRGMPVKGERRAVRGGGGGGGGATRGGEVMARRSGAALLVLAAGSPRGCAQHRRSQPWAGGVPGHGLSRPPPPPWCQVEAPAGGGGARRGREGGSRLANEVLVVLGGVKLQAQIEITCLGLGTVTLPR